MKASMKFRDDQKPILKAKVPISILGLPFQSGIVAGETKELSLNLSTFFESGPSLKLAYRPNDKWNPFSLIVKTGTGSFGSPISTSMLMSAEFNPVGKGNPRFMLHFKPRFGDFEIKKSNSSSSGFDIKKSMNGSKSEEEEYSSIEIVDHPTVSPYELIPGVDFAARTVVPLRGNTVVSFRWGIRVPKEMINPTVAISSRKIPFLVMNKIGIEHVDGPDLKVIKSGYDNSNNSGSGSADVAEACFAVRKKLEELRNENLLLKRSVDDLKEEIIKVCSFSPVGMCDGDDEKSEKRKKKKGDVAEEVA